MANMNPCILLAFVLLMSTLPTSNAQNQFVKVRSGHFEIGGRPYYFLGTNFWYGINLGSGGAGGDRQRLLKELDHLQELGVNNLRIMAASEGPDDQPWRMVPALQSSPGVYKQELLDGLDYLLAEMGKREMKAVLCLNNFWPWSGGMAQYVNWFGGKAIPYPPPAEGGDWARYQLYAIRFYKNEAAKAAFQDHVRLLIQRHNSYTGLSYKEDPTIMAWELANEPRGIIRPSAMQKWIAETARFIKSLDPHHLVTVGSEGRTSSRFAGNVFRKDHASPHIDYTTIHIWVQNWGWYDPQHAEKTFEKACRKAKRYLKKHLRWSSRMGKPLVLEEFGISRDLDDHSPEAPTTYRDQYYKFMFDEIYRRAVSGAPVAGCNFWAWAGQGRPREPRAIWQPGDDFTGDPPHEHQGWYSVYDHDHSTLEIIRAYAKKMNELGE